MKQTNWPATGMLSQKDLVFSPFFHFIFNNSTNRKYLLVAFIGGIVQFTLFKMLYPFPDFISDSYSYIDTNLSHMKVNLWPIGYSKFIGWVHLLTPSHTFLVALQYFILEISLFYFFYSVLYLYGLPKFYKKVLFIFLFFNPIFLYLSNCVLSDAIFCAISLALFTQYLWMFHQPGVHHIVIQTLLIGLAFTIRYTAIYYPFVSIAALLLSGYRLPLKLAGTIAPWLLIIPFIIYTQQKTKEATGTAEFSVFGGWQIANNALYMYDHIKVDTNKLPAGTLELDRLARRYFREVPPQNRQLAAIEGTYFIKVSNAILKPYMLARHSDFTTAPSHFRGWGIVSPVYKKYGEHLIKEHPIAFAQYYLWLNTQNYFQPYLEKFGSYNIGMTSVWDPARVWFNLKSDSISLVPSIEFQGYLFYLYPILFMVLNAYFAGYFLLFLFAGQLKHTNRSLNAAILLVVTFLVLNFCFSVFATPVVLRYQVVPMILLVCFSLFLTERLIEEPSERKNVTES